MLSMTWSEGWPEQLTVPRLECRAGVLALEPVGCKERVLEKLMCSAQEGGRGGEEGEGGYLGSVNVRWQW